MPSTTTFCARRMRRRPARTPRAAARPPRTAPAAPRCARAGRSGRAAARVARSSSSCERFGHRRHVLRLPPASCSAASFRSFTVSIAFQYDARPEAVEPPLRGQPREERVLVVAHVRQAGEELAAEHVDAGAQPVRQQRLLAEADDALAALLHDAVRAAQLRQQQRRRRAGALVLADHRRQRLRVHVVAVRRDDERLAGRHLRGRRA